MTRSFILDGSEPSSRRVVFCDVERPHGDDLTFFVTQVFAESLDASCSIESVGGDSGLDLHSERPIPGVGSSLKPLRLSELFVELGSGSLWEAERRWRSIGGELEVALAVDQLGHVDIRFQISPRPWNPTWSASCTLRYNLGELVGVGTDLGEWFDQASRR